MDERMSKLIGKRIRKKRLEAHMTQTELAKKLNSSQVVIYRWESGRANITDRSLKKLAEVFNCPVSYFTELDSPFPPGVMTWLFDPSNNEKVVNFVTSEMQKEIQEYKSKK